MIVYCVCWSIFFLPDDVHCVTMDCVIVIHDTVKYYYPYYCDIKYMVRNFFWHLTCQNVQ